MANEFGRNIKDTGLIVTKALPAAAANNNTDTIDLGTAVGTPENVEVEISIPAMTANNSASYSADIKLQHCTTTGGSFEDLDDGTGSLPDIVVVTPGVADGTGSIARVVRFRLPRGIKRFIQFNQAVTTGGPTLTGTTVTYSLTF
jgi:hypothetical protein